jgi:uridine kinase
MSVIIIGIAGGTASGKTTISKKLYEASLPYGTVSLIRLDDYYHDSSHLTLEQRRQINFDHPDSYDTDLIVKHLNQLSQGIAIEKPIYDFVYSIRSQETERIEPSNIIIVEGIMIFAIKELRDLFQMKIYVDTDDDITFIRRLKRDINHRGRTVESVVNQYLTTVRPMHQTFVEPSKRYADIIVPEGGKNAVAVDILLTKIIDLLRNSDQETYKK